jgi:hypothetical protein
MDDMPLLRADPHRWGLGLIHLIDEDWLAQEKLFDLRAICRDCHEDVHSRRSGF